MVKTCHGCDGYSDDYEESELKRCTGCRKVYYCSTDCQKHDWIEHIFDCKPRRPVNTAHYLARAVWRDALPNHPQTCTDYGFDRAITSDEKVKLFGLYVGLIKFQGVPARAIHDWRVRGVLVDEIKAVYYKIPERFRGGYFPWFLQNEHLVALAGQPLPEEMLRADADATMVRAWIFTGGSERDSPEEITTALANKPTEERDCHYMYGILLSDRRPSPLLDLFVDFGLAACTAGWDEMALCAQYRELIMLCTFQEFYDAYHTGCLLDLFHSKGLQVQERHGHLRDLLQTRPGCKKSVWYLKQFVLREDTVTIEEEFTMHPTVAVDYGFVNCRDNSEKRQLRRVYKAFLKTHDGDPLVLHEAAIQGKIHGLLSKVVQGLRDPKFRRLMKNRYPLPNPDL